MRSTGTRAGKWPKMTSDHQLELAIIASRYARWLHPDLVARVGAANVEETWRLACTKGLEEADILPGLYLWPGSTCLYPGVRRPKNTTKKGSPEKRNGYHAPGALRLDSNNNAQPQLAWQELVPGFKTSRNGYHLVHLFPHQGAEVKKILPATTATASAAEADFLVAAHAIGIPGLFTSVANMCFLPGELTRPTDADSLLRQVLWQHALDLYKVDFLPPVLHAFAERIYALPRVKGLAWNAPFVGEKGADTWWQEVDSKRQAQFRKELHDWREAQR